MTINTINRNANQIIKRNNVTVFGQGNLTLMFAHGFGSDQNTWRFVLPAFKDQYKIVVFDYVFELNKHLKNVVTHTDSRSAE